MTSHRSQRLTTPPTTGTEATEFAGQLFFRLWRAADSHTADALRSLGLTPALFRLLGAVGRRAGAIQQELSADLGIDPTTMVTLIDQLQGAGLAERRRRPGDRRVWEIAITPKGRRALEHTNGIASQVEDAALSGLSPAQRRRLLALLRRALPAS